MSHNTQTDSLWAGEEAQSVQPEKSVSSRPSRKNELKSAISAMLGQVVSMTRVEVVLPAESPDVPADLIEAFGNREWADVGGSNCFAIFGLDLSRALSQAEEDALIDAWFHGPVLLYRTFTR